MPATVAWGTTACRRDHCPVSWAAPRASLWKPVELWFADASARRVAASSSQLAAAPRRHWPAAGRLPAAARKPIASVRECGVEAALGARWGAVSAIGGHGVATAKRRRDPGNDPFSGPISVSERGPLFCQNGDLVWGTFLVPKIGTSFSCNSSSSARGGDGKRPHIRDPFRMHFLSRFRSSFRSVSPAAAPQNRSASRPRFQQSRRDTNGATEAAQMWQHGSRAPRRSVRSFCARAGQSASKPRPFDVGGAAHSDARTAAHATPNPFTAGCEPRGDRARGSGGIPATSATVPRHCRVGHLRATAREQLAASNLL